METTIDLNGPNHTCEVHNFRNGIQVPFLLANMSSLPHLLLRKTKGKELLINYNQSHIFKI